MYVNYVRTERMRGTIAGEPSIRMYIREHRESANYVSMPDAGIPQNRRIPGRNRATRSVASFRLYLPPLRRAGREKRVEVRANDHRYPIIRTY